MRDTNQSPSGIDSIPIRHGAYPEFTWTAVFVGWAIGVLIALDLTWIDRTFCEELRSRLTAQIDVAAEAICETDRDFSRRSAAWPLMCNELRATRRDLERNIALVLAER